MPKGQRVKRPHEVDSVLKGVSTFSEAESKNKLLQINLGHFDNTQGQDFHEWEKEGYLSQALDTLKNYCKETVPALFNRKFKVYKSFPDHSLFSHPGHITPDAHWASMHVQGKYCVIGHMVENVFFIVFLDNQHNFYPPKK